jgi:hypothetical protein
MNDVNVTTSNIQLLDIYKMVFKRLFGQHGLLKVAFPTIIITCHETQFSII